MNTVAIFVVRFNPSFPEDGDVDYEYLEKYENEILFLTYYQNKAKIFTWQEGINILDKLHMNNCEDSKLVAID